MNGKHTHTYTHIEDQCGKFGFMIGVNLFLIKPTRRAIAGFEHLYGDVLNCTIHYKSLWQILTNKDPQYIFSMCGSYSVTPTSLIKSVLCLSNKMLEMLVIEINYFLSYIKVTYSN